MVIGGSPPSDVPQRPGQSLKPLIMRAFTPDCIPHYFVASRTIASAATNDGACWESTPRPVRMISAR